MDFHNRQYDPQLGRFLGVDALADAGGQQVLSPYHAMACNPALMVDPLGLMSSVTNLPGIEVIGHRLVQNIAGNFVANGAAFLFEGSPWTADSRDPFDETQELLDRAIDQTTGGQPADGDPPCKGCSVGPFSKVDDGGTSNKKLPKGQDPWVSKNKLKNSDGQRVYTLEEFLEYNKDLSYEEIINQRPGSSGQPGGPLLRYVINPTDGNVMDMRHVLVVGYGYGVLIGNVVEFGQLFTSATRPSARNPQDYYSNRIGENFRIFTKTGHAHGIQGIVNQFNDFIYFHAKNYYNPD